MNEEAAEKEKEAVVRYISGNSDLSRKHFPSVGQVPIKASDFLFI